MVSTSEQAEKVAMPVLKIGCKRLLNNSLAVQKPNFILASHGKSQGLESFSSSATLTFETPVGGLYCLEVFYINFDGNVEKTSIFIILELYGPLNVKPRKYFYKVLAPHKVRSSSGLLNL